MSCSLQIPTCSGPAGTTIGAATSAFSDPGMVLLEAALERRPLLAFDFDGTLAPTVRKPEEASVAPGIARQLDQLSRCLPVAVISGRRADDVAPRLGFTPTAIIGSHGAEAEADPTPYRFALEPLRHRLAAHAEHLRDAGVFVEDKGFSVGLHLRGAPNGRRARHAIAGVLRRLPLGVRAFEGNSMINVVAHDAPDHIKALSALAGQHGCGGVILFGTGLNDDTTFRAANPSWLTVQVGRGDHATVAKAYIEDQAGIEDLLDRLLRRIETRAAPRPASPVTRRADQRGPGLAGAGAEAG